MSVTIPDDLLAAANMTPAELLQEIAIALYTREKLSLAKSAELAGMNRLQFQHLLASRNLTLNLTVEDLATEVAAGIVLEADMRRPWTELYIHLVWATWDREPLLTPDLVRPVYACIMEECLKLHAECLAVGGSDDHVHLLSRIPTTVTIAELAKQVKGSSAHLVTHRVAGNVPFKWQGGYGAFTVSRAEVPGVVSYIRNQLDHHNRGDLRNDLEQIYRDDCEQAAD